MLNSSYIWHTGFLSWPLEDESRAWWNFSTLAAIIAKEDQPRNKQQPVSKGSCPSVSWDQELDCDSVSIEQGNTMLDVCIENDRGAHIPSGKRSGYLLKAGTRPKARVT